MHNMSPHTSSNVFSRDATFTRANPFTINLGFSMLHIVVSNENHGDTVNS